MSNEIDHHFLIDIAEIWKTEVQRYSKERSNREWHEELYNYLKMFFVQKQHKPFISQEMVNADNQLKAYYENYYNRLEQYRSEGQLDFFEFKGAFYDMNEPCIIKRDEVSTEAFQKLYTIKLKQLEEDSVLLITFLSFHYYRTFQKDLQEYSRFLSSLQVQKYLLSPVLFQGIGWWKTIATHLLNEGMFQVESSAKPGPDTFQKLVAELNSEEIAIKDVPHSYNQVEMELIEENETNETKESAAMKITGEFTMEEIVHYFSFLHYDKGEPDGSFLIKEEVEAMFREGIVIPAKPQVEKYKLRYTPRYTKKLIEYFIYQFIQLYNVKEKKKILIFFGSYIKDYENALDAKGLENLNKNITGEKPRNLFFELKDLLPERFTNK